MLGLLKLTKKQKKLNDKTNRGMKTIAQQLNIKEFPFEIKDKNGKVIYCEYSSRYWCKYEYDSNGKVIYSEDSDECWAQSEYDSNGNQIFFVNSSSYCERREYDSNGNIIYHENSYGNTFDYRPKGCEGKVVEIDGKKYKLVSE